MLRTLATKLYGGRLWSSQLRSAHMARLQRPHVFTFAPSSVPFKIGYLATFQRAPFLTRTMSTKNLKSKSDSTFSESGNPSMGSLSPWWLTHERNPRPTLDQHSSSFKKRLWFVMAKARRVEIPWLGRDSKLTYSELAGHCSFALLATSYLFQDILSLRILAVAGAASMMTFNYFHPHGKTLWLPFKWNLLFLIINCTWIGFILYQEYQAGNITEEEKQLLEAVFENTQIKGTDFLKLLRAGKWKTYQPGEYLTREGTSNSYVYLVSSGSCGVYVGDRCVYKLHSGQFIGEMGLHVGLRITSPFKSTASTIVRERVRVLQWSRGSLIDLLEANPDIAAAVQSAISTDLVRKALDRDLHQQVYNSAQHERKVREAIEQIPNLTDKEKLVHETMKVDKFDPVSADGAKQSHHFMQQDHDMYRKLLESVLEDGRITNHERNVLQRFRRIHFIPEEEHAALLKETGWTPAQYRRGVIKDPSLDDPADDDETSVLHPNSATNSVDSMFG